MFDSKLLETIRVLTPEEINGFADSAQFNDRRNRKEVIALYELIVQHYPNFNHTDLGKEAIHQLLFGKKPYVENRVNHVMTALLRILEAYIGQQFKVVHDTPSHLYALCRFYQERGLTNRFEATIARFDEVLNQPHPIDEDLLWWKFKLALLKHIQSGVYNPRTSDLNLFSILDHLEQYYITQRILISAGILGQSRIHKIDTSKANLIFDQLDPDGAFHEYVSATPLIQSHYKLHPLLNDTADINTVHEYRTFLRSIQAELPPQHVKPLYTLVRNFLVRAYNKGDSDMLPLLFENLKEEYERGFLKESNGSYRANTVQNVVTIALKLKQFDWVYGFIRDCKQYAITGTSQPENVVIFNDANYYFHIGKFDAALDTTFHLLKYDNFYASVAARRLEIMIWYAKDDANMAEYRLNALKSYLFSNKDKMPEQIKHNNDDFVDVMRQLLSPRNQTSQKRMEVLQEKMHTSYRNIAEREWLLEKINATLAQ